MNLKEYKSCVSDRLSDQVKILFQESAQDIIYKIIHAIRECRQTFDTSDTHFLYDMEECFTLGKLDEKSMRYCIEHLHNSVFEHVNFSFELDLSRVAQLHLVRHRISSFSGESFRVTGPENYFTPDTIKNNDNPEVLRAYNTYIDTIKAMYNVLVAYNVPMEDARYILPGAAMSKIQYTANLSSLRHAIAERTCKTAQKEIRDIFLTIKEYLKKIHPVLVYKIEKYYLCPDAAKCGACL